MLQLKHPYRDDELISSLHKCIRANDFFKSCYFAKIIKEAIGVWRVKQYIFYIVFEETLNVNLYEFLLKLFLKKDNDITDKDIYIALYYFCNSTKKWDCEEGLDFYLTQLKSEIDFMEDLVNNNKRFNKINDVGRLKYWESVITETSISFNKRAKTFKKTFLYGLPELFYYTETALKNGSVEDLFYISRLFYMNKDVLDFELLSNIKEFKDSRLYNLMNTLKGKYAYIFNYFTLFYSLLRDISRFDLFELNEDVITNIESKINNLLEEGNFIEIPLIALDPHTARGKSLFSSIRFGFSKKLDGIDLRFSGKWYAVIWRMSSYKQFKCIADNWEDVEIPSEYLSLYNKYCRVGYKSSKVNVEKKNYEFYSE